MAEAQKPDSFFQRLIAGFQQQFLHLRERVISEAEMNDRVEKNTSDKIWHFVESPVTWGGLGLLGGAIIVLVPAVGLKYIFVAAWVLIVTALIREGFWYGKGWLRFLGNAALAILLAGVFAIAWRHIPMPKEPTTPDEIADAYFRKYGRPNIPEPQPTYTPQPHSENLVPTPPSRVRDDGKKIDVAIGPSPQPTYAYETRFILSNHNFAKLSKTFYVCETQKIDKNKKLPGLIVRLAPQPSVFQGMVGDLPPGYSFSMYCDFAVDLWANDLERPELNLMVYYQYEGQQIKRGFKFLALPNQDGNHTFVWVQRGEAE